MNKDTKMRLVVNRDKSRLDIAGVYLITDQGDRLVERVSQALRGGAAVLQYRDKGKDPDARRQEAMALKELCRKYDTALIINDDIELAKAVDADGVHLGQGDSSPVEARNVLGFHKIIGISTHNAEEALKAEADGADYIGFGSMYPTATKEIEHLPGPDALAPIKQSVKIPVVAIGGINRENACRVIDSGADALAVISAVLGAPDPGIAAAELRLLFNRKKPFPRGGFLTIAGSDSGGGAGIQADIKTATLLGSYAASVITALTAQNTRGVSGIHGIPPSFVADQLDAVLADIPLDLVKTGMLYSAGIISTVADKLREYPTMLVVVDPVMIAKGGAQLADRQAVIAMRESLFPLAYLVTPNIPEAERLTGIAITDEREMEEAARILHGIGVKNVLVKGGHLPGGESVDILFDGRSFIRFPAPRLLTKNTHGTGCTYASAIATYLAQGEPLRHAVARAKEYIHAAIRLAQPLGKGHGPVNHYLAAEESK